MPASGLFGFHKGLHENGRRKGADQPATRTKGRDESRHLADSCPGQAVRDADGQPTPRWPGAAPHQCRRWRKAPSQAHAPTRAQDPPLPCGNARKDRPPQPLRHCRDTPSSSRLSGRRQQPRRRAGRADGHGRGDRSESQPANRDRNQGVVRRKPRRAFAPGRRRIPPWPSHGYSRTRMPAASNTTENVPPATPLSAPKSRRQTRGSVSPPAVPDL